MINGPIATLGIMFRLMTRGMKTVSTVRNQEKTSAIPTPTITAAT